MFTYTDANGRVITENDVNVQDIFEMRWLRNPAPRWMGLHREIGIPFHRLTAMRESAEYRVAATTFLREKGLGSEFVSERNLTLIGVKAPEQSRTVADRIVEAVTQNAMSAYTTKYGVEIEFLSPVDTAAIEQAMNESGVTCRNERYNHQTRTWWKIVYDASVSGKINGVYAKALELVSPPLTGEEGYRQVEVVCGVLERLGCKVNRKCGLHVHVEASDLSLPELRNVCIAWAKNEHIISSLVPASRRGGMNAYCKSRLGDNLSSNVDRNSFIQNLKSLRSKNSLISLMCPQGRYWKLNMKSMARHGTLEFRYHSGSISANKINQHIRFCIGFVHQYKAEDIRLNQLPTLDLAVDTNEMLNVIADAVNADEREQFISHFEHRQRQLAA